MKELAIALALILVFVGAVAWWSHGSETVLSRPADFTATPRSAEKPKPVPKSSRAQAPAKRVQAASKKASGEAEPLPAPIAVPPGKAEPAVPTPPPPFPTIGEVAQGADADKVVEQFGEPALWTTSSGHQHIQENFIYARDRGQVQTLIRIEDGRVLSVASDSRPAAVTAPIPIPRVRR